MEDLVALGEMLADIREFADADRAYRQALRNTGTFLHSPWHGFAFSSACSGENSCLSHSVPRRAVVRERAGSLTELRKGPRPLGGNICPAVV